MAASAVNPPVTKEDVSVAWLSDLLGHKVKSFETTSYIGNETTAKLFLTLTYEDDDAETERPDHLCLKGSFNREILALPGYAEILQAIYTREVKFFELVAPKLKNIRLPKTWGCVSAENPPVSIVAMDDLGKKGYTFGDAADVWPVERVLKGVEQLAALHASTWGLSIDDLPGFTPVYEETMVGLAQNWDAMVLSADRPQVCASFRDQARTTAALRKHFVTKNPRFLSLLHGDPHPSNTYLDAAGDPSFLDWQICCVGSVFHDVTYFVVGALSVADRRAREMDVLDHYLAALARFGGPALSRAGDPDLLPEYRKSMMSGLGWVLTPYEMQPRARVEALVGRYSAAFEDHQVIELIESLPAPEKEWAPSYVFK